MATSGPVLIVIEGLDSLGKTTQAQLLAKRLALPYIKGGGWFKDSNLARRASREGNRDRYFSLMQLKQVKAITQILSDHQGSEGIIGICDRFVLVDVAHILSRFWNEESQSFTPKSEEQAREMLDRFIPPGIWGIVLDTENPDLIEERTRLKLKQESLELPSSKNGLIEYLKESDPTDADTLDRFEAKRAAWQWCANYLGWPLVSVVGTKDELTSRLLEVIEGKVSSGERETRLSTERSG